MPYGQRIWVERLLREMEAQKHALPMQNDKEEKIIYIDGQVRSLPFGVYEYVFPKENLEQVLNTLINSKTVGAYHIPKLALAMIRKALNLKPIPEFSDDKKFLWVHDHVSVIPLGIREDGEIVGQHEFDKGFTHEAI